MRLPYRNGALLVALSFALGSCASMPSSAPTANQITGGLGAADVDVVDIVPSTISGTAFARRELPAWTIGDGPPRQSGIVEGDILSIAVYETGYSLFASNASPSGELASSNQKFPPIRVPEDGLIHLPYAGTIKVAGLSPPRVAEAIEAALRGKSQFAQALVTVEDGPRRSVILSGDVEKPGRVTLTEANERLLDAVALASGSKMSSSDTLIKLTRGNATNIARLNGVESTSRENVRLAPGDRIELVKDVRSITLLGAAEAVSEIKFDAMELTLGEALARGGGPADDRADPTGVFIFRIEARDAGGTIVARPVIYRLNLLDPASYFAAQTFQMRENDIMLVANARSSHLAKFLQMVNALAAPVVTADLLLRP